MRALQLSATLSLLAAAAIADGNIELVSIGFPGASAHGDSNEVAVSADGRYVVFASDAADLVLGDLTGFEDIFVSKFCDPSSSLNINTLTAAEARSRRASTAQVAARLR